MRRPPSFSLGAVLVCAGLVGGCHGASNELGNDAWMTVAAAQYEPGPIGAEGQGPEVEGLFMVRPFIRPGEINRSITGALAEEATAVTLALEGDRGRWIVVAGPPDVATPGLPSFAATVGFSEELPLGTRQLLAQAFNERGEAGPTKQLEVTAAEGPGADGAMVVSLSWDTDADLDLHVIDALGVEIHKGNINSWKKPPPGKPPPPDAFKEGAMLDLDSNAQCVIDGRCQENVVWAMEPPPGHYIVRVDTFSLCDEVIARWTVAVVLHGDIIASAQGTSTPFDAAAPHGIGAGVLALEIDVP